MYCTVCLMVWVNEPYLSLSLYLNTQHMFSDAERMRDVRKRILLWLFLMCVFTLTSIQTDERETVFTWGLYSYIGSNSSDVGVFAQNAQKLNDMFCCNVS